MSDFYGYKVRSSDWNYGGPKWKLSRSKIDLFMDCPRCFYLDNKLGVARPKGPSFTLNIAVDALLKKEFDLHRVKGSVHPLLKKYGVDAIPFSHDEMGAWRENFVGIQHRHEPTGFLITGAVDDIWIDKNDNLIVVDYKATSKDGKMDTLDDTKWQNQYKRQMEIYQWLLRQQGFNVSDTGYFVYVNGKKDKEAFDGKLEFDVTLIAHTGKGEWIENTLLAAKKCLDDSRIPKESAGCDHCSYIKAVYGSLKENNTAKPPVEQPKKAAVKKAKAPDAHSNQLF
jgi:hypothetical protein